MRVSPLYLLLILLGGCLELTAQCTSGSILVSASSGYDFLLDPNLDGYISNSGSAFTSDTTEKIEFETIPNSTTGWISIIDVSEKSGDVTPVCGNSDLLPDGNGGDFAFYNIVDPTPLSPSSGDEYIILRFRLAQSPNGNFGYNFLFDTDNQFGAGIDLNSTCGNRGFEREVQFANAGGQKGVSVYDVDGTTALSALSPPCNQCIALADIQEACAGSSGTCGTTDPIFISFPLLLSFIGVPSDIDPFSFYVALATASSGNATSVLGGGNVTDLGAIEGQTTGCALCVGLIGCDEFDCQLQCINTAFVALPVEWNHFDVYLNKDQSIQLDWSTMGEFNSDYFVIERSINARIFESIATVSATGFVSPGTLTAYSYEDSQSSFNSVLYYRLKQVDMDGRFSYSPTKSIRLPSDGNKFALSPNPVKDLVKIAHLSKVAYTYQVQIYDLSGRLIETKQIEGIQGENELKINMDKYKPGAYFINLIASHQLGLLPPHIFKVMKLE